MELKPQKGGIVSERTTSYNALRKNEVTPTGILCGPHPKTRSTQVNECKDTE